jgi:hypothetical protein
MLKKFVVDHDAAHQKLAAMLEESRTAQKVITMEILATEAKANAFALAIAASAATDWHSITEKRRARAYYWLDGLRLDGAEPTAAALIASILRDIDALSPGPAQPLAA